MAQQEPGEDLPGARLLPLDLIDPAPWQPRQHMDAAGLTEMTASIAAHGLLQPILVRPGLPGRYILIAGSRRTAACRAAGLTEIPAIILEKVRAEDAMIYTATENLQREDLSPEDEARMYGALIASGVARSNRQLATMLGVPATRIDRATRMLPYPKLLRALTDGTISRMAGLALLEQKDVLGDFEAGLLDASTAQRIVLPPGPERPSNPPAPAAPPTSDPPAGPAPALPYSTAPRAWESDGHGDGAGDGHGLVVLPRGPDGAGDPAWVPTAERRWRMLVAATAWAELFDPLSLSPADQQLLLGEIEQLRVRLEHLAQRIRYGQTSPDGESTRARA